MVAVLTCAPARPATTGQIVGTIVDSESHRPIAKAAVTATAATGNYRTVSDAKGVFTIVGVVPDTYTVTVTAAGYAVYSQPGVTVTTDEATRVQVALSKTIKGLGVVRVHSSTSAYQPDQTVDRYTLNSTSIAQLLGKNFNLDQKELLRELPGVTVDKNGTALIRGGFSFQTAFQFEGIDYTEPSRSVGNRFENVGNGNILNGVGTLEIIPGGGDATHGNTGTGLVSLLAKRGTYPAFATADAEVSLMGRGHQFAFDFGSASRNQRLSNYVSFVADSQIFQWGAPGTDPAAIGAAAFANDPAANSNINAHTGALYTSAYFNPSSQQTNDFLDNLIYKFGHQDNQSAQLFVQTQSVRQNLDYGGFGGLTTIDPAHLVLSNQHLLPTFNFIFANNDFRVFRPYLPTTPGGFAGDPLFAPEFNFSPFSAFKVEYSNILNQNTALGLRFFRTFSQQQQFLPSQGVFAPSNGGSRTGISGDISKALGTKHYIQVGAKYEFAHPFGSRENNVDYLLAFDSLFNAPAFNQIAVASVGDVIPDFITPLPLVRDPSGNLISGTPGCAGPQYQPGSGNPYPQPAHPFQCGYLASFFPNGKIPPLPTQREIPTANQQIYGLYAQDTITPNSRIKALVGLRLDGYNFLLPGDAQDPPAVNGIRHQRLFEPHLGLTYKMGDRDAVRANFGRTLSIPLPTFLGLDIDRSLFDVFRGIPSFDNLTGKPAMYCGPGAPVYNPLTATLQFGGSRPCKDYADQLYWLERNYRFGQQGQLNYPLRGATFTNYDLSYEHEYLNGTAIKLTPFYRRGYDVVEVTRTLQGVDVVTGAALYSGEVFSNLGLQRASGIEFDLTTRQKASGFSGQVTATYINQFGNDPPGGFLPTASLQLGQLYHSPSIAPFQATFALTYRNPRRGLQVNPVFTYRSGYPYGQGVYQAITVNGMPVYIPISDAVFNSSQSALLVPAWVNPQNPGSIFTPNIVGTQGTESLFSGPGTLKSSPQLNTDVTIQYIPLNFKHMTYGLSVRNLFSNTSDIPVVNLARDCQPVSTGICASLPGSSSSNDPTHHNPIGVNGANGPYIIFPNQAPINVRLYVQMGL